MESRIHRSPHARLADLPVGSVRWTGGFWAGRFEVCRTAMVPNMWRLMSDPEVSHAWANFRIAAGLEPGAHKGPKFSDGDFYKWLEAASAVRAVTRDAELDRLLDEIIAVIAKAQRADGYLHTPVLIQERAGGAARELADRLDFEMYNLGHLMAAACVHYVATGKTALLEVAEKAARYLDRTFARPTAELAKNAICPSHYMGLVAMHRTTGQSWYLDLARRLFDMRELMRDGSDDNQDRIPFRQQRRAVGHAVRANYYYAGAADIYAETGDRSLLESLEPIWENVATQKMYVTGATGALYDGVSPYGGENHDEIQRTHQAYGLEYQLPNLTAYNETCANIGNILWNWRMFRLGGQARFADIVELVLYNSALSGVSLDGTRFFYQNTLREVADPPFALRWPRHRVAHISSFCCPPNIVRMVAGVGAYAYSLSEDGVWVNLYGGNVLDCSLQDGSKLRLVQASDYPWEGRVRITVEAAPARALALHLRIPGWARGAALRVGGNRRAGALSPGSYTAVRRRWIAGDTVELELPLPVRLLEAHPLVEEVRNHVAVMRGPVVYCLESVDLRKGVGILDVMLPEDVRLEPRPGRGVLRGLTVLEGTALALPKSDWSGLLYRQRSAARLRQTPLRLIPYFAWDNREPSDMTVWLPVCCGAAAPHAARARKPAPRGRSAVKVTRRKPAAGRARARRKMRAHRE